MNDKQPAHLDMDELSKYPPEYGEPTWPCGITQEGADRLRVQYLRAVKDGVETFFIDGKEVYTGYAKYLLEYLDASAAWGGEK